jgi:hypothetical protein
MLKRAQTGPKPLSALAGSALAVLIGACLLATLLTSLI